MSEFCLENSFIPKAFMRIGLNDTFSSVVGSQKYLRKKYKMDVVMEEQAERLINGRRSGKNIGVRFNRPSGINVQGYSYIN